MVQNSVMINIFRETAFIWSLFYLGTTSWSQTGRLGPSSQRDPSSSLPLVHLMSKVKNNTSQSINCKNIIRR